MMTEITVKDLYDFEDGIVQLYKEGRLRSPIHLSGSVDGILEDFLINIFKNITKEDWVFSTWRSHYHALLKGIPKNWLKQWILDNKSIHVMNNEYHFVTSAIVAGILPTALGVALGIKLKGESNKVYVFIGDMAVNTGSFAEVFKFSINNKLPIYFVCECNFLSTDTDTAEAWGTTRDKMLQEFEERKNKYPEYFNYVVYKRKWPHYGCGVFIEHFVDESLKQEGTVF